MAVISSIVVVSHIESSGKWHLWPTVSIQLCSRFLKDAYNAQPFVHPIRCLRRRPGSQLVRLPAVYVQKAQQCVAGEMLLSLCFGLCGGRQQRQTQHFSESQIIKSECRNACFSILNIMSGMLFILQSDTSFGSSRSIKNLRRSNSTTQVNQQANIRYKHRIWALYNEARSTQPRCLLLALLLTSAIRLSSHVIMIINVINQPSFYQSICERVHMKGTMLAAS